MLSAGGAPRDSWTAWAFAAALALVVLTGTVVYDYARAAWPAEIDLPYPLGEPDRTPLARAGLLARPPARPPATATPLATAAVARLAPTAPPPAPATARSTAAPLTGLQGAGWAGVIPRASAAPTPRPAAAARPPTPTPPVAAPRPAPASAYRVAHTDGDGVYLRASPHLQDKLSAWPQGVRLESLGGRAEGDGMTWARVRAPDGSVGWVPTRYLEPIGAEQAAASPARDCRFVAGFARLRARLGAARVGDCLENERRDAATGDTVQRTTRGTLVWRPRDGGTAFDDGRRTWVLGPRGLQERAAGERFAWESRPEPPPAPPDRRVPGWARARP